MIQWRKISFDFHHIPKLSIGFTALSIFTSLYTSKDYESWLLNIYDIHNNKNVKEWPPPPKKKYIYIYYKNIIIITTTTAKIKDNSWNESYNELMKSQTCGKSTDRLMNTAYMPCISRTDIFVILD